MANATARIWANLKTAMHRDDHTAMDGLVDQLVAAGITGDEINDRIGQWTADQIAVAR